MRLSERRIPNENHLLLGSRSSPRGIPRSETDQSGDIQYENEHESLNKPRNDWRRLDQRDVPPAEDCHREQDYIRNDSDYEQRMSENAKEQQRAHGCDNNERTPDLPQSLNAENSRTGRDESHRRQLPQQSDEPASPNVGRPHAR